MTTIHKKNTKKIIHKEIIILERTMKKKYDTFLDFWRHAMQINYYFFFQLNLYLV